MKSKFRRRSRRSSRNVHWKQFLVAWLPSGVVDIARAIRLWFIFHEIADSLNIGLTIIHGEPITTDFHDLLSTIDLALLIINHWVFINIYIYIVHYSLCNFYCLYPPSVISYSCEFTSFDDSTKWEQHDNVICWTLDFGAGPGAVGSKNNMYMYGAGHGAVARQKVQGSKEVSARGHMSFCGHHGIIQWSSGYHSTVICVWFLGQ